MGLDLEADDGADRSQLVGAEDKLNLRSGSGAMLQASPGLDGDRRGWSMKQVRLKPVYTTQWDDMPVVRT